MQRRRAVLRPVVKQRAAIHQRNQQFIWFLRVRCQRERRVARIGTVEIRIQTFGTHFSDLLDVTAVHTFQKAAQICTRVQRLQLFFVNVQHFVDAPLVFQLSPSNKQPKGERERRKARLLFE